MAQHGAVVLAGRHDTMEDCVIERNLIVGNREGFNFREQTRATRSIDARTEHPVWNHDELIRHNLIVRNRDAQVWGWFDVNDNRHWPVGSPAKNGHVKAVTAQPEVIAGAYAANNLEGQPQGLTLEKQGLRFEHNV